VIYRAEGPWARHTPHTYAQNVIHIVFRFAGKKLTYSASKRFAAMSQDLT
jgi:hypothetical protein